MEFLAGIVLTIILLPVLMSIMSVVLDLVSFLLSRKDVKLIAVRYLWFKLEREKNTDRLVFTKGKFVLLPKMSTVYRDEKLLQSPSHQRKNKILTILVILFVSAIFAVPFFFLRGAGGVAGAIGDALFIDTVVFSAFLLFVLIKNMIVGSAFEKVRIDAYTRISNATSIEFVDIPPLEDYADMKKDAQQENGYQFVRFIYGKCKNDMEIMTTIANWMEFKLPEKYNSSYDSIYYCLFAYYGTYNIDNEKATRYYNIVKDLYDENSGPSLDIKMAYYFHNVVKDDDKASYHLKLVREGLTIKNNILKKVEMDNVAELADKLETELAGTAPAADDNGATVYNSSI